MNRWSFSISLSIVWIISTIIHRIDSASSNATKETSLEKPLAASISRLPPGFQDFVINSTNLDGESTIVNDKVSTQVKEVREPPEMDEPPPKVDYRNKTKLDDPSPTPSNENYVTIGHRGSDKSSKINHNQNLETGFKPFIPSPYFNEETTPRQYFQDDGGYSKSIKFKSSPLVNHEQFFTPEFNNHPSYGDLSFNDYTANIDLPYQKFNHEKLPYITTYAPPKINPMQRPNLNYKGKKKYPTYSHHHNHFEDFGKTEEFAHSDFNHDKLPLEFHNQNAFTEGQIDDHFLHNYPKTAHGEKPFKNSALWQIFATLLPIGLFLSALPPKVIFINATSPPLLNGPKPFFRNTEDQGLNLDPSTIINSLVANAGLTPSDDINCNKKKICSSALAGSGSEEKSSFAEYSLWYLLSRSTPSMREKLHLEDVFEAVQQQKCERFSCSVENATQINQT